MKKICTKCNNKKDLSEFTKHSRNKDGLNYYCKICTRLNFSIYFSNNKIKVLNKSKEYYYNNIESQREIRRKYHKKPEVLLKLRIKSKIRRKNDSFWKLKTTLRSRICNCIKLQGYSKRDKTEEILGEKFSIVKKYIESLFKDGMTWDNHGDWHIDHIIPLSSAKTEDELIKLCHYTNL